MDFNFFNIQTNMCFHFHFPLNFLNYIHITLLYIFPSVRLSVGDILSKCILILNLIHAILFFFFTQHLFSQKA